MSQGESRSFPFKGWVVWLTAEQGGRNGGPPAPRGEWPYYAANAYVPPATADSGLVSFVLRGFDANAWRSGAEACWLVPENPDAPWIEQGSVVVVTEGPKPVGFFVVERISEGTETGSDVS
jgi:hypothetical protein